MKLLYILKLLLVCFYELIDFLIIGGCICYCYVFLMDWYYLVFEGCCLCCWFFV